MPSHLDAGNHFVNQSKKCRNQPKGDDRINQMPQCGAPRQCAGEVPSEHREDGAQHQRYEETKCHAEHHAKRKEAVLDDTKESTARLWCHFLNGIHGVLQLAEDARCTKKQRSDANDRADDAGLRRLRMGEEPLDRFPCRRTDEIAKLIGHLIAYSVGSKHQPRDGHGDHQQRSEGQQRVIRKGRSQTRNLIVLPSLKRFFAENPIFLP